MIDQSERDQQALNCQRHAHAWLYKYQLRCRRTSSGFFTVVFRGNKYFPLERFPLSFISMMSADNASKFNPLCLLPSQNGRVYASHGWVCDGPLARQQLNMLNDKKSRSFSYLTEMIDFFKSSIRQYTARVTASEFRSDYDNIFSICKTKPATFASYRLV